MTGSPRRDRLSGRRGIPLAFTPWVAYWTLSGMGYSTAVRASGLGLAMALGSVTARSPFIAQYVRDDWPSGYREQPVFYATSAVISALWGGVFLIAGVLHLPPLGLSRVAILLAAQGLALLGIVASLLLSRRFPRWALARRT